MADWFLLTLVAMVFWGTTGLTQKLSTNHVSAQFSYLGFVLAFVPVAIVILVAFPVDRNLSREIVILGIAGGVLNGLGTLSSFAAFESGGKASIVVPVIYLYPLVTVIGGKLFLNEQLSVTHWTGVVLAPLAAWLLSRE
jgi:transporter family protein